jgi:hypothetical protein
VSESQPELEKVRSCFDSHLWAVDPFYKAIAGFFWHENGESNVFVVADVWWGGACSAAFQPIHAKFLFCGSCRKIIRHGRTMIQMAEGPRLSPGFCQFCQRPQEQKFFCFFFLKKEALTYLK